MTFEQSIGGSQAVNMVDLTNCDREPIQIPGSIQPHGCLLVCDSTASIVLRHSLNARQMLDLDRSALNGAELEDLVSAHALHEIRNALARSHSASRPGLVLGLALQAGGTAFDVAVHANKGHTLLEFVPSRETRITPLELSRALIGRLDKSGEVADLLNSAARIVRAFFEYDRVMVYRFAADGSGEVASESKRGDLERFIGQHFPASDIPQQARQLYLANTIRVISDAQGARVALEPVLDASGEPLDLSFAHLRSVSPIHCEYLRNMGVSASMSISVIVGGRLWGLVACHHYAPKTMTTSERVAAEMFGEFFSLHLEALLHKQRLDTAALARQALDRILVVVPSHENVGELLKANFRDLMGLMPCDGVGLLVGGAWSSHASTPPAAAIPALARMVETVAAGEVWATNHLSSTLSAASDYTSQASGVLVVPLSQLPRDYLFFFRREVIQTVNWGGDPKKRYESGPLGDRLTPRKSFAIWKQTVEGQSLPWTPDDRAIAEAARSALVEIVLRHSELLADERSKAEVRQKMLNEELNHRVKNILALIKSLVSYPTEPGTRLEDYVASLKGRIQALGFAHDQVVRGDGGGGLRELLDAELSPYRDGTVTIEIDGPVVSMDARAFSVMALVLHELATNAAKYGALSSVGGKLAIAWQRDQHGDCEIVWQESGGPVVVPPSRQGFGSVLVGRSIPFDLGGRVDIEYRPAGLHVRLVLPSRHLAFMKVSAPAPVRMLANGSRQPTASAPLSNLRIMLLEDQLLIAMDAEDMLVENGAAHVEMVATVESAIAAIDKFSPDAAVLDVNLGHGTSLPVAEHLLARGVPFIFATGYGDGSTIPSTFAEVPAIRKPYDANALVQGLLRSIEAGQPRGPAVWPSRPAR